MAARTDMGPGAGAVKSLTGTSIYLPKYLCNKELRQVVKLTINKADDTILLKWALYQGHTS